MKRILVSLLIFLFTLTISAQAYLGGSLSYSNGETQKHDLKTTTLIIKPELGYALNAHWAVGATLDLEFTKEGYSNEMVYSVAPYVRYKATTLGRFTLFADAVAGFEMYEPDGGNSVSGWSVAVRPGVAVALSNRIFLVTHLGHLGYYDTEEIDGTKSFKAKLSSRDFAVGLFWKL